MAPMNHSNNLKQGFPREFQYQRLRNILHLSFFGLLFFIFLTACKPDFQPLEANDRYFFSMYGMIDAGADTQWVRITPVREQVDLIEDGSDLKVTLENLDTGQEFTMNDSLFIQGRNVLNFWTDEPVEHNQAYRLTAELSDGNRSEVTVNTPDEMPLPKVAVLTMPGAPPDYYVLVDESVNLADIQTKYYVRLLAPNLDVQRTFSFSYRNEAEVNEEFPGYYSVEIFPDSEIEEIERVVLLPPNSEIEVVYRQVYVATSATEWNEEIESLDDVTYSLPQTFQNVENGLGYVLGIDSKYIPYEGCTDEAGNILSCGEEARYW